MWTVNGMLRGNGHMEHPVRQDGALLKRDISLALHQAQAQVRQPKPME
jgi:hypothetical protein